MKPIIISLVFLISSVIMTSCSPSQHLPNLPDLESIPLLPTTYSAPPPSGATIKKRLTENLPPDAIHFEAEVKPILDSRCVVCHACYDAPCQLKLGSMEGIERGATTVKVYDGKRLFPAEPTRLFTDANSVTEWREKGFFPVLNEQENSNKASLNNSLLYQAIKLKQEQTFPQQGLLPESFKLDNYRDLSCPTIDTYSEFKKKHPQWGMPYGLPALKTKEYGILTEWLKQGATFTPRKELADETKSLIAKWENFLNQRDKKSQLISRYLYEHLTFGHLYFDDSNDLTFFSLVRSSTPPKEKIKVIATPRPYDDPKTDKIYYRLQRVNETIVDKSHLPFALNQKKMERLKELFWAPDFKIHELPKYSPKAAANPFETYAAIPAKSRYLFLLDNAHFFISNFIKGPVCWGPIALNVINDRFFVTFTNPETDPVSTNDDFLKSASPVLNLPAELEDHFNLTVAWTLYARQQKKYLQKKQSLLQENNIGYNTDFIWPGNGPDGDGALTIFRHHDSATVLKGFIGDEPKTAWVLDYPLFERIYYLLVAGFNVYGNVGHQLSTRLYMDFLRMEGERNFIHFLPGKKGFTEHQRWYKSIPPRVEKFLFDRELIIKGNALNRQNTYQNKRQVLQQFSVRTQITNNHHDTLSLWNAEHTRKITSDPITMALQPLSQLRGKNLRHFPDLSYLRIKTANSNNDRVYTLIKNKAHSSVHFVFGEDLRRQPKKDTLTLVHGLVGSYPNYIYSVPIEELEAFIKHMHLIKKEKHALTLNEKWGIRRTYPNFWEEIDWLQEKNKSDYGQNAGLFDLNRYLNL